jgi:hypothetical protein
MLQGMASLDNSSSRILGTGAVPEDGIVEGVATSLQGGGSWASQAEPPQSIVASTGSPINPECSQKASLYARICSRSIMRKANKPSGLDEMTLNIRAEGTADFELAVAISSALQRAGSSAPAVALDVQKADQMASLFGQQLSGRVWFGQPQVSLSYQKQTSQFEELIGFSQRGCSDSGVPQELCPADGDTLTTWVRFTSASDASVWSEVAVTTDVQALPSCDLSVVNTTIAGRSRVSPTEPMSLSVAVMDVDGLPIRFTRADVRFTFDNRCKANPDSVNGVRCFSTYTHIPVRVPQQPVRHERCIHWCVSLVPGFSPDGEWFVPSCGRSLPIQWSRGSNLYSAAVPERPEGVHLIVVTIGLLETCELLRRTIHVAVAETASNGDGHTERVVTIAVSAGICFLILLASVYYVKKNLKRLRHILLSVATEAVQASLFFLLGAFDLVTDMVAVYRCLFVDDLSKQIGLQFKIVLAISSVGAVTVGIFSFVCQVQLMLLLRKGLREVDGSAVETEDEAAHLRHIYEWEAKKIGRLLFRHEVELVSVFTEDIPFAVIYAILIGRQELWDTYVRSSSQATLRCAGGSHARRHAHVCV